MDLKKRILIIKKKQIMRIRKVEHICDNNTDNILSFVELNDLYMVCIETGDRPDTIMYLTKENLEILIDDLKFLL